MIWRHMPMLFGIMGLGAFFVAAFLYFWPPIEESVVEVQVPDCSHVTSGRVYEIDILIHNRSGRTLRIIGGGECLT